MSDKVGKRTALSRSLSQSFFPSMWRSFWEAHWSWGWHNGCPLTRRWRARERKQASRKSATEVQQPNISRIESTRRPISPTKCVLMPWRLRRQATKYFQSTLRTQDSVALAASIAVGLAGSCLWPTTLGVAADPFLPQVGATMFGVACRFWEPGWNSHAVARWRDVGLVILAAGSGHFDSLPTLLMAFVLLWMQRRPVADVHERHPVAQAASC
jgi:hypothetical protein